MAGAIGLGTVVTLALHVSDTREFVRITEQAQPWLLLMAVVLQAATYLCEGQIWRGVAKAAHCKLKRRSAYGLSLTKLFVDQTLPTAGISGTVVLARSLEQRGMDRPAVMAGVVIDFVAHYVTFVVCLATALIISIVHRQASPLVLFAAAGFGIFAITMAVVILVSSGRGPRTLSEKVQHVRVLHRVLSLLESAEPSLSRRPTLMLRACAYKLAIFFLDASTMWVLIRALGADAPWPSVFASYMISSLFRTIGILPGGLGTFEATSVLTLKMTGIGVPVALAATLLFRGLSFWLPMLPGVWLSHRAVTRTTAPSGS
jgi:Mg2+-importing ATPase